MDTIWELRGSVIPALTLWTSTTARARSTTFLRHRGCLHSSKKPRRIVAEMGQEPGIYFGTGLGFAASSAALVRRASRAPPASACYVCCALSFGRQL